MHFTIETVEGLFRDLVHMPWGAADRDSWSPPIDLYETENGFWLSVDLPGVDPGNVQFQSLGPCSLLLCGVREPASSWDSGQFLVLERNWRRFCRPVRFSCDIDLHRKEVHTTNGTFRVFLPKSSPSIGGPHD